MRKLILTALAVALVLIPTIALAGPSLARQAELQRQIAAVRAATAKYHDESVAIADGYIPTDHCFDRPGAGMGYHYFNPSLGTDLGSDPLKPDLLIYVPTADGGRRLGAVEYFEANVGQEHPSIMGQPYDGPMAGHEEGMPEHYDLHFWIWQNNPDGVFTGWNPDVSCANVPGHASH